MTLQPGHRPALKTPLGASGLPRYGYAVLEHFIEPAELPAFRTDIVHALAMPQRPSCERPNNTLVPMRWNDNVVARVLGSEIRRNRIREVTDSTDLRWISGYLSLKEPRSPSLWWHQDWWCWDHPASFDRRPPQVALLCYVSATDDRSAALRVLPGSHRVSTSLHALLPEAHSHEAGDLSPTHPAMSDHPEQVTLQLRAGDAVVLDYRVLHGTHANRTDERRDCLLLTFAPSWSALPAEIKAHLIRHPALPQGEDATKLSWASELLPTYAGLRRDLPLNRAAPRVFSISDDR